MQKYNSYGRLDMPNTSMDTMDFQGKRTLIRVDFNVPMNETGEITDDTRIRAALPTISRVLGQGGRVILMSHLGRPKGKVVPSMSLQPVSHRLSELLEMPVAFAVDTIGESAHAAVAALQDGEVVLLENLRYSNDETDNDPVFAAGLAKLGDVYINDAFGTAHRAHASTAGVCSHFTEKCAGLLMQNEISNLGALAENPRRPYVAVLGGAKVKGKVEIIENLLDSVDTLLLGGGMVFTFFKAQGLEIGDSIMDEGSLDVARAILEKAERSSARLVLPVDCTVADAFSGDAERRVVLSEEIPAGWQGLDIGPDSLKLYREIVSSAKSIFWNGPMGVFEIPEFATGTRGLGEAVAEATDAGAHSVVGGGDSVAAVNQLGLSARISHISTGGGASLEFMAGRALPGITALGR
jgi:phosphoglycerate kinase